MGVESKMCIYPKYYVGDPPSLPRVLSVFVGTTCLLRLP